MSENLLSFDNNNSNFKRKKLFKRNNSNNLKETKDIFILKQDAYLLKLLEKKIKLKKIYKSKKLNQKVIRLINPRIYKDTHDENNTSGNFKNKKINQNINYRNIIIRRDKKQTINNSFINRENEKGNILNFTDNLITSKLYNNNISKNNKNILKIINKDDNNYKVIKTKFNNNKSLIKFPKIYRIKSITLRNNGNITNYNNSYYDFNNNFLKEKNKHKNYITLFEKRIFQNNKKKFSLMDLAKKIQNNSYQIINKEKYNSHVKNKKHLKIN